MTIKSAAALAILGQTVSTLCWVLLTFEHVSYSKAFSAVWNLADRGGLLVFLIVIYARQRQERPT